MKTEHQDVYHVVLANFPYEDKVELVGHYSVGYTYGAVIRKVPPPPGAREHDTHVRFKCFPKSYVMGGHGSYRPEWYISLMADRPAGTQISDIGGAFLRVLKSVTFRPALEYCYRLEPLFPVVYPFIVEADLRELTHLYVSVLYVPESDERYHPALHTSGLRTEAGAWRATGYVRDPIDTTHGSVVFRFDSERGGGPLELGHEGPNNFDNWGGEFIAKADLEPCPAWFSPK